MFCSEAKQLTQQFETFCVHAAGYLENHCSELESGPFKVFVVVRMLLRLGVTLARLKTGQVVGAKRASHRDIDGKAFASSPDWDCDIPRSATVHISQKTFLFHHRREHAFLTDPV